MFNEGLDKIFLALEEYDITAKRITIHTTKEGYERAGAFLRAEWNKNAAIPKHVPFDLEKETIAYCGVVLKFEISEE